MDRVNRRKPRNYKGRASPTRKTSRRELSTVERAFIAGACMAGNLSHNDCANLFGHNGPSKSTITRTCQRVQERVAELQTTICDPRCYDSIVNRGRPELLTTEQRAQVVVATIATRESREKESWQAIKDGDFMKLGLPNFSVTHHQNIMYSAGYACRRPGWRPQLTDEQQQQRYEWALCHNPDKYEYGDGLGFDFREVVFTDETPARIGEERGMQRAWAHDDELYDKDVKKDRNRRECCLQFYGAFRYDHEGPCHTYFGETEAEKQAAEEALQEENTQRQADENNLQGTARRTLGVMNDSDVNHRYYTRKKQYVPSQHDYKREHRGRGGIDGYRHREGALSKVVPWISSLKENGIPCLLLQDGTPAHKSRIARDYLTVQAIDWMWWPGYSPEVNASDLMEILTRSTCCGHLDTLEPESLLETSFQLAVYASPSPSLLRWLAAFRSVLTSVVHVNPVLIPSRTQPQPGTPTLPTLYYTSWVAANGTGSAARWREKHIQIWSQSANGI